MTTILNKKNYENLQIDCDKCFGFCCAALYFTATEGFPTNKDAGNPCVHLKTDFKCKIHNELGKKGLKGCMSYDCFGAGQKVAQVTYNGQDWIQHPKLKQQMFDSYLVMRQLYEMLWYLTGALQTNPSEYVQEQLTACIEETEAMTMLNAIMLNTLNLELHREKVNQLLAQTSERVRSTVQSGQKRTAKQSKSMGTRADYIGADLRKSNSQGADFRGALLIAANLSGVNLNGADFIAADVRDTNFKGADLRYSLNLTQMQINAAIGDLQTKLPVSLIRPSHWS